jgi:hypothetical protein
MRSCLIALSIVLLSFHSYSQKGTPPPLDSTGKDYGYYFTRPFTKPQTWDSTVFYTKKFMDSFYVDKWKMVKLDTVNHSMKIRCTSKLKSRGMLKNTHRPIYSNCYMTYDFNISYTESGLNCKVKRIIHYYIYNLENSYMGSEKRSMMTEEKEIEIPLIQTDLKLDTKIVLIEANKIIAQSIEDYKNYKWVIRKDPYDNED